MSVFLHVGLLAWATLSIQSGREFRVPKLEPMAVSIITADELTRLKKGSRAAKQLKAISKKAKKKTKTVKAPKKIVRKAVEAVKPPPPVPEPPKPEPEPAKEEPVKEKPPQKDLIAEALKKQEIAAKAEAAARQVAKKRAAQRLALETAKKRLAQMAKKQAEAEKKAQTKKNADAKRKAAAKRKKAAKLKKERARKKRLAAKRKAAARKKRLAALRKKKRKTFDPDRLSALLNKLPDDRAPELTADEALPRERRKARAGLGAREGRDDRLTASEEAVLKSIISRQLAGCWSLPGGGGGTDVATVTLSWRLTRSGRLDGEPRVVRGRNDVLGRIAQEAAIRAVKSCVPFRLPPDKYNAWQIIEWKFDPSEML